MGIKSGLSLLLKTKGSPTLHQVYNLAKVRDCENDKPSELEFNKHDSFELLMALLFTLRVGLYTAVYRKPACVERPEDVIYVVYKAESRHFQ